jgi:ribosomal protein S8
MRELLKLVNLINLNRMYKKKYFEVRLFLKATAIFKILIKLNIVNFIKKKNEQDNKFIIFLNLENKLKLVPMVKKSKKYITYFNIKRVCSKRRWTAILSTSQGLLTTKECLKKKTGGMILFNILVYA